MITKRPQDFSHGGVYDNWFHNLFYHPPPPRDKSHGLVVEIYNDPSPHPPRENSHGLVVKI